MKRREFIKSVLIGAVVAAHAPTDFLTPFSQEQEFVNLGVLTPEMFDDVLEYWRNPAYPPGVLIVHPKMKKLYEELLNG